MWRGPAQDPGGSSELGPPSTQELDDLKDQFEQQQLLIAQLKEMLRKNEQTTVTQEKVEEYANTLTKMNARAKKNKKEGGDNVRKVETPASEKINLLRQQLEENKVKLAERGKSQKGIEEMVIQLKAQLDDSQSMISQTPLNLSFIEAEMKTYTPEMSSQELFHILTVKERRISEMSQRMQKLEANVLDLQENLKEKDSVIDARTKAITLMSENLSKKGKSTLDALDDTKLQMRNMQENFIELEQQMKEENQQLRQENNDKDIDIANLQESNSYLQSVRQELSASNAELQEKVDYQGELLESLQKGGNDEIIEKLHHRIKELEDLNQELRKSTDNNPGFDQEKFTELDDLSLQKTLKERTYECLELNEKLSEFQIIITEKEDHALQLETELKSLKESLKDAEPKSLDLELKLENQELTKLKKQLDESNKNMIKVKAQHKAKIKELTKKIDTFKKMSDVNAEVLKFQEENSKLSQRIAELEEEKGALQLKMMETSGGKDSIPVEAANELERQLTELSEILTYKDNQISTLSNSLEDSNNKIKVLNERLQALSHLQNVQVKSEMTSIELEEQVDKLELERAGLIREKIYLERENKELLEKIDTLNKEKQEVIQENMDLIDKLEKLSAEKVSSAESIEIVEGLTQQEKLELEAYQKSANIASDIKTSAEHLAENLELNESVNQLNEETSELLQKIELFTVERREVMDKMEQLTQENSQLNLKIKEIENNRDVLAETYEHLQNEKEEIDSNLQSLEKQKVELENCIRELRIENTDLKKVIEEVKTSEEKIKLDMERLTVQSKVEETREREAVNTMKPETDEAKVQPKDVPRAKESPQRKPNKKPQKRRNQKSSPPTRSKEVSQERQLVEEQLQKEAYPQIDLQKTEEKTKIVAEETILDSELQNRNAELMKEIHEYRLLIDIQRQEIQELKVHLMGQDFIKTEKLELEQKFSSMQEEFDKVYEENRTLNQQLKDIFEKVHEKDGVESELKSAKKRVEEFEKKLSENITEICHYKTVLEENKTELISSTDKITNLQNILQIKEEDLSHYKDETEHLNSVITDLNSAIHKLETENQNNAAIHQSLVSDQLEGLKDALKYNIEQINEYEEELNRNTSVISELQTEIKALSNKILETEYLLENKNDELNTLQKKNDEKQSEIEKLNKEIQFKNENFHETIEDLKNKCLVLQTQITTNTGSIGEIRAPLEDKIKELEEKNKEQLEKMKKIAANLKKKTVQYQDLEQKYAEISEKWETELKEKELKPNVSDYEKICSDLRNENSSLKGQMSIYEDQKAALENKIEELSAKLNKLKGNLECKNEEYIQLFNEFNHHKELSQKILDYEQQIETLQSLTKEYEDKIASLTVQSDLSSELLKKDNFIHKLTQKAKSFKQQVQVLTTEGVTLKNHIDSLTQQLENQKYDFEINSNALKMKIQELELYAESKESELTRYKDQIDKLEDGLQSVEERRMSLERKAIDLGAQLEEKNNEFEEVSQTEDILERRIKALLDHDEVIERRLQETVQENDYLNEMHKKLILENKELAQKLKCTQENCMEVNKDKENIEMLEGEITQLKQLVVNLDNEKKHIRNEFEQRILNMKQDNEKAEVELQSQIEFYNNDHKILTEKCEMLLDQIKELNQYQELLNNDIEGYKEKLYEQQQFLDENQEKYNILKTDFENKIEIIAKLNENNFHNENKIKELENENRKLNLETSKESIDTKEIENLRQIIEDKSMQLEEYQKENLQIKMQVLQSQTSFNLFSDSQQTHDLKQENENLTSQLIDVKNQLHSLRQTHSNYEQIQQQLAQRGNELQSLKEQYNVLQSKFVGNKECAAIERSEKSDYHVDNIGTFTWPETKSNDDFVIQQNMEFLTYAPKIQHESPGSIDNQNEIQELLNKIKSLEFMLFTAEKDKEETLNQCETLSSELAKLLYDRQNINLTTHNINFDFESQIVQPDDTKMTESDISQLHQVEFTSTKPSGSRDNKTPVVEDVIQPKAAYLCYPENSNANTFGENDDGWGWGPEEAKLEQEHLEAQESVPDGDQFSLQMNALEEKIRVLEQARERHLEEIKQSQLKSGKLIKKLKEFKLKNEELATQLNKKSDDLDDLNVAIEDELKSQIKNLEKKIKDISSELDKEKGEKCNLSKRVDTLTLANERLVENKEKQDVEIMSWQQKTRELSLKLEQFEWGDGGFETPKHVPREPQESTSSNDVQNLKIQVEELTETIRDLTLDNDELQALLEEQRHLRISAEKAKSVEPISENMKTEAEYLEIIAENKYTQQELETLKGELQTLNDNLQRLQETNEILQKDLNQTTVHEVTKKVDILSRENSILNDKIIQNEGTIDDLNKSLETLQDERHSLKLSLEENREKCNDLTETNIKLEFNLKQIKLENANLQQDVERRIIEAAVLETERWTTILREKEELLARSNETIKDLQSKFNSFEEQLKTSETLNAELLNLKEVIKSKEEELLSLKDKLAKQDEDHESKLLGTTQQLTEEWMQKVDQRGYDIAESWKLHLESRENEFYQVDQTLRKEISELEEKHNALVNENNELRKNVDAEIRNEVDRISALQAQINEKQYIINELSAQLEKQKNEINNYCDNLNKTINEKEENLLQYEILKGESEKMKIVLENKVKALLENEKIIADNVKLIQEKNDLLAKKDIIIEEKERYLLERHALLSDFDRMLLEKEAILKQNVAVLAEKDEVIASYKQKLEEHNINIEQIQNYESQIKNLQQQIYDKENELIQLRQEIHDKENTIIRLNQQVVAENSLKEEIDNCKSLQSTLENQLKENNEIIENLHKQLESYRSQDSYNSENMNLLHQQIYDYQQQLTNANIQLQQYYQQIEILNQEVQKYSTLNDEITYKDDEILKLNSLINEKDEEFSQMLENKDRENAVKLQEVTLEHDNFKRRLAELETHYEESISCKDMDVESYKIQLQEQVNRNNEFMKEREDFMHVQTELALKNAECEDMKIKLDGQNMLMEEEQKQLDELRQIIEDQVLKIQDLQKELYEKSRNYDALIAEVDITNKPEKKDSQTSLSASDDLSEPVSRAELDLALYMLHQRDVRCEELTVELMQLLEERDTLQLKLSNALREKEDLRSRFGQADAIPPSVVPNLGAIPKVKIESSPKREGTSSAQENLEGQNVDPLNIKLSELKSLSYRKDKTLLDEQQLRRLQQFSIMQQHRDEASKLPPEAAARLVDASYTLSRDVQSPSKVLLNWLWGRSTPKVNDI